VVDEGVLFRRSAVRTAATRHNTPADAREQRHHAQHHQDVDELQNIFYFAHISMLGNASGWKGAGMQ
jgi:hypothetical protein